MRNLLNLCIAALTAALLASCSDGTGGSSALTDGSGARGSLIQNPPIRVASLTATDFAAQLTASGPAGQQLLLVTGAPVCGIDFHYIQYGTVDGGNPQAPTTASGALMVPTGGAGCSGPRPILLYAHGTATDRNTNLADITNLNNTEGALIAAMFAAQGFIVVAPNYAGYDSSPLPYHPFLNGDQQSKEMIDALAAARKALGNIFAATTTDSGKLFITGYSQGGYVAMATQKAMEAAAMTVTAAAPMSGPYAVSSFGDAVFFGNVNLGSTVFAPMLTTSYRHAFPNASDATTDIFEAAYAGGIDAILPNVKQLGAPPQPAPGTLFGDNQLPVTFLFNIVPPADADIPAGTPAPVVTALHNLFPAITPPTTPPAQAPLFALGFGPTVQNPQSNLIKNTYRAAYLADALVSPDGVVPSVTTGLPPATPLNNLRKAFKANDMRSFNPQHPIQLCGGGSDPTVFFSPNTLTMQGFFAGLPSTGAVTVLDVDTPANGGDTLATATAKGIFAAAKVATATKAVQDGATDGGVAAVTQAYHATLVPPACAFAVRAFFIPQI